MGLQCSILGHAFGDAEVEREREQQGSEVITTEREVERCRRCGTERVVSESTEVAAVVDASDVGLDDDAASGEAEAAPGNAGGADDSGGFAGAVERSDASPPGSDASPPDPAASPAGVNDDPTPSGPDADGDPPIDDGSDRDPAEEDAEILTDDGDAERAPGQWPDDAEAEADTAGAEADTADAAPDLAEPTDTVAAAGEESLSGITVPEGEIACPACSFRIEANSGYRAGDPCPDCNAWLEAERNQ